MPILPDPTLHFLESGVLPISSQVHPTFDYFDFLTYQYLNPQFAYIVIENYEDLIFVSVITMALFDAGLLYTY